MIDFVEFITLVKGRHLGLSSLRRKAFRLLLKETVEFLVPYKYTYQVYWTIQSLGKIDSDISEPVQLLAPASIHAPPQSLSDLHLPIQQSAANQ